MSHPSGLSDRELLAQCDVLQTRRGGPGGQHRNKVSTAIVLTHRPSGVAAEANERRSQADNRRVALFRLRVRLALSIRMPAPPERHPNPIWRKHVSHDKLFLSADNQDFPLILSEALDFLAACDFEYKKAASICSLSGSQFLKLLKLEPAAWSTYSTKRLKRGRSSFLDEGSMPD